MDPGWTHRTHRGAQQDIHFRREHRRPLKPPAGRHWHNILGRILAEGSGRTFNFLLSVVGARILDPAVWGLYWSAFSAASLAALFADLGGHLTLARDASRRGGSAFPSALALKLVLTLAVAGVFAVSGALPGVPANLQYLLVGSALCISFVEWLGCWLRGLGRVASESMLLAVDCLVAFLAGFLALSYGTGTLGLAASQALAHAIVLISSLFITRGSFPKVFRLPSPGNVAGFLRDSLPTGIAVTAMIGSWKLGTPILLVISPNGEADAGVYAAAHRILEASRFFPAATAAVLFPAFAARKPLGAMKPLAFLLPAAILVPIFGIIPGMAEAVMKTLYGISFLDGAATLSILLFAFPLMTATWLLSFRLVALHRVWTNAALNLLHPAIHALTLFLLVPRHGVIGAALALVVAESVLCLGMLLVYPSTAPARRS